MIRVLQVVTIMNRGGEETMIMNYYRNIDRTKVQFDFLVHRAQEGVYEKEIALLGGKVYRACPIRPGNYTKYKKWLKNFFDEHKEYTVVHSHIQENSGFVLSAAKKAGIKIRVAHSHIAPDGIDYKFIFREYAKLYMNISVTDRFACGEKAGKWLHGKENFVVIPNAVDTNMYHYNQNVRNARRRELGIEDNTVVVGNVARFHPVKNQTFMIDIFKEYQRINPNSILMLVGVGDKLEEVKKKANDLNLSDSVWFMGLRTDINEMLQVMDLFLFPSMLEGLPLSVIEAQAAGLPCLLSDVVTREVGIIPETKFISLSETPEYWAMEIKKAITSERRDTTEDILRAHYDIKTNTEFLQNFYLTGRIDQK